VVFVKPKTRYGAFAYHLLFSAIIFAILAYLIVFVWYPGFLFWTDGGWQGVRLIAGVDLVLGPFLTLIIYKATKPTLKFDLAVIACVQIVALAYGAWLVHEERPRAVVFADAMIRPLAATVFPSVVEEEALKSINKIGGGSLAWLYVDVKKQIDESMDDMARIEASMRELKENGLFHVRYEAYQPFAESFSQIVDQALDVSEYFNDEQPTAVKEGNVVYRFRSRYAYGLIELDGETLEEVALHNVTHGL